MAVRKTHTKQIESLAEPLGKCNNRSPNSSIYDTHYVCRTCRLQYPKSCTNCDDCGKPLATKPRRPHATLKNRMMLFDGY